MTSPEPVPATPEPAQGDPAQGDQKPEPQAPAKPETDWRAEAKKWETRAKENKSAADKLAEIENASKTELERIQARAEAAEKRAADLEAAEAKRKADEEAAQQVAEWKAKITGEAAFEGVPASALRGSTEKELREHAKELKALIPERKGGAYVPAEGRHTGTGSTDPRTQFIELIKNT